MIKKCLLVTFLLAGVVWGQSDSVSDAVNQLPTELQGKVDQAEITKYENQLKQRCEKNGGEQAYDSAQKAINDTKLCFESLVDTAVLQQEIKAAKPSGGVDEVFKKYCAKKSQLQDCFHKAVEGVKPCFSSDEQSHLPTLYNITDQLAEFVCFKDGDRIALFIAEGGPECFQDRSESIQECWNTTMGVEYKGVPTPSATDSIPKISFGPKQCGDLTKLQNCVVKALEACEKPTTANIVESLFKFAREVTPCSKYDKAVVQGSKGRNANAEPANKPGSASGLAVTSATLLMAVAAAFLA